MFFPLPRPLLILLCQYVKTLVSVFSSQIWDAGDVFCLTVVFFRNGDEDESSSLLRLDFDGVSVNASSGGVIRSSPTSCLESLAWWCVKLSTRRRHQLVTLLWSLSFSSWQGTLPLAKKATAQTGLYSLVEIANVRKSSRTSYTDASIRCTGNQGNEVNATLECLPSSVENVY
ncbi:hypothetical protein F2Q69_00009413 [Brassica cretica]|uniref:Secreted protein n=1 Tax=Brassica cretica TaxID=69181 RepID=A0A8S9P8F6_BRACR|nr:hypothetical protein F2Q69_00009413 [Brassica cretica]